MKNHKSVVKFRGTYDIKGLLCETVNCSTVLFKIIKKRGGKLGYHEEKMEDHADSKGEPKITSNLTLHGGILILRNSQPQTGYSTEYSSQNSGLVEKKL